ncbi:Protein O-mannosyltransferase 2 [Chytridiales sp. JEL 0842]|nr:Protein O-mannosyltransferase 2 [Chytridiales sp. JEL 0842]
MSLRKILRSSNSDELLGVQSIPLFDDDKEVKLRRQAAQQANYKLYYRIVPAILTFLSLWVHLYKISWANYVVWDEAHFGKFASYYLKREFYFDVHPPLGKMLLGLAGLLSGYKGDFGFESGKKYPETLNYTGMRIFGSLFGALTVPLAYYTGLNLHLSKQACVLFAVMVMTDIALLNISRFILLDSMLLFFTALSVYCLTVFRNYQVQAPFSKEWYIWLGATGAAIGAVTSVKWVGLFSIALVGLHTIEDLWEMLGDLKMPKMTYVRHWVARILLLIILPIGVYAFSFVLHFWILNKSGTGDAQMSSLFQAGLEGNSFTQNPIDVAFGSKVTFKNNAHGGGLLHSHSQVYPSGSGQQQVTCYHHKDSNNDWIIEKPWGQSINETDEPEFIKDGSIVRLVHQPSGRNLHSQMEKAPVTTHEYEVEIIDDMYDRRPKHVKALTTRILLRHLSSGCLLRSGTAMLPQWGFKQAEVVCQRKGDVKSANNMWNVEQHWNPKLKSGGKNAFRRKFWKDFIDLNVAMWTSNNALTPDPDREPDNLTSSPYQWPLLLVGLRMCGWGDNDIKFFLLGHPIIWRRCDDWESNEEYSNFYFAAKVGLLGWILHYGPFWIMGRVTYLHHYFPALYFAILTMSLVTDHFLSKVSDKLRTIIFGSLGTAVILVYLYFADFAFGIAGPASAYKGRKWMSGWNIYN